MQPWRWYIYILECNDNSYYVGLTWKPEIRYEQHVSHFGGKYTARHGVKRLVYLEEYTNFEEARLREKQIKGWTRQKKKKLIQGQWTKL